MGKAERAFLAGFGLFLFGVGVYAMLFGVASALWNIGGGIVLAAFGANMLYAAYSGKPSWLSWLGPLP